METYNEQFLNACEKIEGAIALYALFAVTFGEGETASYLCNAARVCQAHNKTPQEGAEATYKTARLFFLNYLKGNVDGTLTSN